MTEAEARVEVAASVAIERMMKAEVSTRLHAKVAHALWLQHQRRHPAPQHP